MTSIRKLSTVRAMQSSANDDALNRRVNILVVEDNEDHRELVKACLQEAGYDHVFVAEDALFAMEIIRQAPPDLMIVDINMPHESGLSFISSLRANRILPYVPVIFVTGRHDCEDDAKKLGAVGYLRKPLDPGALLKLVSEHTHAPLS
jgi:CheY-like chemotaxis protein